MIVHVEWELAKSLLAQVLWDHKILAIKQVRTSHSLSLEASKELVEALTDGNFTVARCTAIVEVSDTIVYLDLVNCPPIL